MKNKMRNLLIGIGVVSGGFAAYALWDDHVRKVELKRKMEQEREAARARKIAEFIEKRKAMYARRRASAQEAEANAGQESDGK